MADDVYIPIKIHRTLSSPRITFHGFYVHVLCHFNQFRLRFALCDTSKYSLDFIQAKMQFHCDVEKTELHKIFYWNENNKIYEEVH